MEIKMAAEEPQKQVDDTLSGTTPGQAGTLNFVEGETQPVSYILEGWALPPKMPRVTSWETHIAGLRSLQLREDDIFLCAYPKAGTHWLWEVLSMLLQGKAQYDNRVKEQLMMEISDLDKLEQTPSPRIFNSHLPFFMLPWKQMKEKKSKVLHVYRNPKDSCVSYYHHMKGFKHDIFHNMAFDEYFELFFYGRLHFDNYFEHLKQVHKFTQENPDVPLLSLSFEDMKKNPVDNVKKLAKFLGIDLPDTVYENIAEACSFQNLKRNAEFKTRDPPPPLPHPPPKDVIGDEKDHLFLRAYRKGEIGDWRNYFTETLNERVDPFIEKQMAGLSYIMQYS
ncbi:sulfotransferase 1A3-like isoform X2 [Pomacea canaliculata]|uniref:sulfotransferase 1A3-like isoform X2 n=1 Tax=Pomacea canaliculata TaxID=400727 RepID=UPI000D73374D|nr:sulfotransferase 1A3-like isoform X2 [Pomacea canaliculata]XP_025090206.1 sulfotransferase 1A3-like isoform X2 [Pomacea canaliculata]XP_025090207.1 sulfotransferase 1A3-like isoform X2 [Pomacea canaliculata]XP_025090208.1 sulfotransferase 1A3-like isoform X2 [Pomacea canaliculata]XP_025090210.1 sulfotransferase 1A3-like isoform X2 [Pomacea canaliculata]